MRNIFKDVYRTSEESSRQTYRVPEVEKLEPYVSQEPPTDPSELRYWMVCRTFDKPTVEIDGGVTVIHYPARELYPNYTKRVRAQPLGLIKTVAGVPDAIVYPNGLEEF